MGGWYYPKMKPMFALSLSFEGIQLLHRGAGGWRLVDKLGVDTPDLNDALVALRNTASLIEPGGVRCKIIIPVDQIKYLSIRHDAANTDDVDKAARDALEGATPYDVKDLAYDVSQDDDVLHIAAVAYETLAEAEAFAAEHDFNPVCFTAIPGDAGFLGAPDFGMTAHARTLLKPGEVLEPDAVAVVVVGAVEIPAPPVDAPAQAQPKGTGTRANDPVEDAETTATIGDEPPVSETGTAPEHVDISYPPITMPVDQDSPPIPAFSSVRASRIEPDQVERSAPKLGGVTPVVDNAPEPDVKVPGAAAVPKLDDISSAHAKVLAENPADFLNRRTPDRLPPAPPSPANEAESLTVFGARSKDASDSKPRYLGFVLTALLLLSLGGVATWATFFLDNGVAELLGEEPDVPVVASLETPETDLSNTDAAVLDALREPAPPEEVTPKSAEARYAVSGIWQVAPQTPVAPELIDLDDIYIASIDGSAVTHDAIALPSPTTLQTDTGPAPVSSPAESGTLFAFDDAGLVIPTAAGVLAPSGITVYLGRPPVVPPRVPDRQLAPTETENLLQTRLSKLRPRLRPGDLVEQNERSQLGGLTRNELASVRPRARPELAKVEEEKDPTPTAQAVATSRKPNARPRNFARIVKRAKRASPEPTKVAAAATFAPAVVVPKIPTSASVSKQATVKNAINLGRINLIGVYGKPSSRRALVRLSSGRYKKVKVGDRIDGGRISAIGDSELSYVKGSRSVVLKMPKS